MDAFVGKIDAFVVVSLVDLNEPDQRPEVQKTKTVWVNYDPQVLLSLSLSLSLSFFLSLSLSLSVSVCPSLSALN